jgi:hypothetical protein
MGFFDSKEAELRRIPFTQYQRQAIQHTAGLLNMPTLPQQQVAGLSLPEQMGQDTLTSILSGSAFQDPRTSDLYRGLRAESMAEEERGAQALRRRGQMGGMLNSSSNIGQEGLYRQGMANNRLSLLGGLYEQERARDNPYTQLAAASQYGSLPRLLEQATLDAAYADAMAPIQFQYGPMAQAAQSLFGMEPTYYMTTPEPSLFSQLADMMQMGGQMAMQGMGMPGGVGKTGMYTGKM